MLRFFYTLLFITIIPFFVLAQRDTVTGKTAYSFWIDLPIASILNNNPPILVFLHGASLSGSNLNKVKRYGVLYAMDRGQDIPAIVVAPQCNGGWDADKVMEVIDYVVDKYNADKNRVYVCGMSMGAYGTMEVAGKYPDRIAAAVAICGGGKTQYASNLSKVPLWIQHGNKDFIVPMSESKKIVKAIKQQNKDADVTLTIIRGGNHGNVENLFHKNAIYDWMFKYSKKS